MGSIRQSEDYHVVIPKFYTDEECDSICELITTHSEDLIRKYGVSDLYADNGYQGLTALHASFNWIPLVEETLGIDLITRLISNVDTREVDDLFIKSWCNLWSTGEGIKPHRHASLEYETIGKHEYETIEEHKPYEDIARMHMISGNVFLSHNTHREYGTWYQNKGWVENIRGDLHLFSPLIVHSVDSNTRQEPRMSQAFDIHIDGHLTGTNLDKVEVYNTEPALDSFLHVEIDRS